MPRVIGEELSSLRGGAAPAYTEFRVCILDDEQLPAAEAFKATWLSEGDVASPGASWRCQIGRTETASGIVKTRVRSKEGPREPTMGESMRPPRTVTIDALRMVLIPA